MKIPVIAAGLVLWGAPAAGATENALGVLGRFPPGRLAALAAGGQPDERGFVGSNRPRGWIEAGMQRSGCMYLIAAVVAGDRARADRAWSAIDATFARQQADGGFLSVPQPEIGLPANDTFDARIETAFFFLQEFGHAVLVIRQSPLAAHFRERLAAVEPKLRRACTFLRGGYDSILRHSGHAANRLLLAAKAFGFCGRVLGDAELEATARRLVAVALGLRDAAGVFIENGGRDSSYNAVTLVVASVLLLHLPWPELEEALPAAMAWQKTRIKDTGEVEVAGNTRTGVGRETYLGRPKKVDAVSVVYAFTYYGLMRDDAEALALADRVFAWMQEPARS